jgi:hypothetical protein
MPIYLSSILSDIKSYMRRYQRSDDRSHRAEQKKHLFSIC